jgi:hypothetical protein
MKSVCVVRMRTYVQCLVAVLSAVIAEPAFAIDGLTVVRVEEDWELVVSTPQTSSNSPQVTCAMSPVGSDTQPYMSFELNHQSQPEYEVGGLHVHSWSGEFLRGSAHSQPQVVCQTSDELISWTQAMSVSSGTLTYAVINGSSTTWGSFGNGDLQVQVSTSLTNLNAYSIQNSLDSSGVGFGSNRVDSLILKRVRYVTDAGDVFEVPVNHDVLAETE